MQAACTPSNPQPTPWGEPSGSSNFNGDDPQVTFLRGEGWVSPKTTISSSSSSTTRWKVDSSGTTSSPLRPALANPDIGCLINTLALGLCLGTPRINTVSGKAMPGETEVSFKQWYHEVQCVKDHYQESVVQESIVQSLKGAAADMAHYMGPTASVTEILQKLMVIFGTVASFDVLCKIFIRLPRVTMRKCPPLPQGWRGL